MGGGWATRLIFGFTASGLLLAACGGKDESIGNPDDEVAGKRSTPNTAGAADGGEPGTDIGGARNLGGGAGSGGASVGFFGGTGGTGGKSGTGGNRPSVGNAGRGNGGNPPIEPGTGSLGSPCNGPVDCVEGLTCITDTMTGPLGVGAPPLGLCTLACAADDDCTPHDPGALCYPFDPAGATGFCVEGCAFGAPAIGEVKCHNRAEFACSPALLADTGFPCTTTATDCETGELCIEGTCSVVFPACLPSCRGDIDCAADLYCDQSFLSGVCVPQVPTGKALGEPCTVPGPNDPSEPDECLGFCQADATGAASGHCAATCGLISSCAWNSATGLFDGICFYASILTSETGDIGDFGFCTPTCNCTEECNDAALVCSLLTQGALNDDFRGPGLCFTPDAGTEEYNQCQ